MRYYDTRNKRLVYIEKSATPEFWDNQWKDYTLKKSVLSGSTDRFVFPITKRYLKPGAKILEGGCGKGQFVYSLHTKGYDVFGVDFAEKTVAKAHKLFPELKISTGDVRKLDFPENSFDGYWSLGVIEHFYDGYDEIAKEMLRVLKPGGYLFLTFPYMSPLRKMKARLGWYPSLREGEFDQNNFYQFALPYEIVIRKFEALGFSCMRKKPYEGFKGLKDEVGFAKAPLQFLYDNKTLLSQVISYALSLLLAPFSSHAILLIFRKRDFLPHIPSSH